MIEPQKEPVVIEGEIISKTKTVELSGKAGWYQKRITESYAASVDSILATCRLLAEAKGTLEREEWKILQESLIFTAPTIRKMIQIGESERFKNARMRAFFPPHWYTLYEIMQLPEEVYQQAMADGSITPEVERKQIEALKTGVSIERKGRRDRGDQSEETLEAEDSQSDNLSEGAPSTGNKSVITLPLDAVEAEIALGILGEYAIGILQAPKTVAWEPHQVQEAMRNVTERLHARMQCG
ncbi:MAG: hypothetical protein HQL64_12460 [Magnetococcales bacterium]|nr:hypothetical protein [Magnetococcales bacterium]